MRSSTPPLETWWNSNIFIFEKNRRTSKHGRLNVASIQSGMMSCVPALFQDSCNMSIITFRSGDIVTTLNELPSVIERQRHQLDVFWIPILRFVKVSTDQLELSLFRFTFLHSFVDWVVYVIGWNPRFTNNAFRFYRGCFLCSQFRCQ